MSTSEGFFRSIVAGESQKATTPLVFPGGKPFSSPAAAGPKFVQAAPPAKPALSGDIEADYKEVAQNFANYIQVMETRKDQVERLKRENRDLKEQNDKLMKRVSDFEDVDSDMHDLREENVSLTSETKEFREEVRAAREKIKNLEKQVRLAETTKAENKKLHEQIARQEDTERGLEGVLAKFELAITVLNASVAKISKAEHRTAFAKLITEADFPEPRE